MKKKIGVLLFALCFLAACQQNTGIETPILSKEVSSTTPQMTPTYATPSTSAPMFTIPNKLPQTSTPVEAWDVQGEIIVSVEEDSEIQFFKEDRIVKVSFEGMETVISPKGYSCTDPLLSPDETKLLFQCNQSNKSVVTLYLYDLLSNNISSVVTPKFYTEDLITYTWKADSSSIFIARTQAFWTANVNDENWTLPSRIYFVDLEKKSYSRLFENKTTVINLWWLPKQDKMLFQFAKVDLQSHTYFPFSVLDLEGNASVLHITDLPDKTASISPGGDFIAFVHFNANSIHIISTLNGDQIAQLSAADGFEISDELPIWSLSRKSIGYTACTKSLPQTCKVFFYNLETRGTKFFPCKCTKMAWLNSEEYFAYIQDKALFIYSVRTNQSKEIFSDNLIWDIPVLVGNK